MAELVVAAAIICVFACGAVWAMAMINRRAQAARLETLALAVAQQRIDEILTVPWQVSAPRPSLLAVGSSTDATLTLGNDDLNNQTGLSSAFTTLDLPVNATRTTTVTDVSSRLLRAAVSVSFTYRGKSYIVSLSSLRATDSI